MKVLSQIVKNINESPLTEWDAMVKNMGPNVIRLNAGQPDFNIPSVIAEAIEKTVRTEGNNFYTPVGGTEEIRKAISLFQKEVFHMDYDPEEIILTNGAKEGLFISLGVLVDHGDEVIIVAPHWSTYSEAVIFFGGNPVVVNADKNFHLDVAEIKKAITSKTKAIIINTPNNPTGVVYTEDELRKLAEIVTSNDLYVIADEVYATIIYNTNHFSIASIPEMKRRTILINGFSKNLALTGYRIGYLSSSVEIIDAVLKIKSNSTGNTNSLIQAALSESISEHLPELKNSFKYMNEEFQKRRDLLCAGLLELGIEYYYPEGAFYVFARIPESFSLRSKEFSEYLLNKAKVALSPGIFFGENYDEYVRISFSSSEENIKKAINRISKIFDTREMP